MPMVGGLAVLAIILVAFVDVGMAGWRLLGPAAMAETLFLRLLGYLEGIVMQPFRVLIIGCIVLLDVWRMRQATRSDIGRALEKLRERYDRGDITREQY